MSTDAAKIKKRLLILKKILTWNNSTAFLFSVDYEALAVRVGDAKACNLDQVTRQPLFDH